ncbi:MAG: ACP S-malonyltransferase, partial [Cyanobacteria bacterium]|nr:ACP S-malonyltransferase [Cyanobacteriota bacterium]
ELKRTLYTQPAILATSLVAYTLFQEQCNVIPQALAGHSLGEYGALFAGGVIDLDTAAHLVKKRSELMENAPPGAMSAVLGASDSLIASVIQTVQEQKVFGAITVANYNTPDQAVISGTPEAIGEASTLLKEGGAKRVLPLPVGGAFHSPLMDAAAEEFRDFVRGFTFQNSHQPIVTNTDASPTLEGVQFQSKLADQINHSVRWSQTVAYLVNELGIHTFIEFGPGKVLTGMVKKMYPDLKLYNVFDSASLSQTCEALNASESLVSC